MSRRQQGSLRRLATAATVTIGLLLQAGSAVGAGPARRQRAADEELAGRMAAHPTLRAAWGDEADSRALAEALAAHTDWHVARAGEDYYRETAARVGREGKDWGALLPRVPGPDTIVSTLLTVDERLGFGPPPEFDRFGRPRVIFSYRSDAPTWGNRFFGIGPDGARMARDMSTGR